MSTSETDKAVPALLMRDVTIGALRDPSMVVAEQVSWTVMPGDYWVVAGLQGAGKSDFLMLAGGLMAPARGTYEFFGQPMPMFEETRLADRLRLGLAFDGGQLFNHLTVAENIALPLRYHQDLDSAGTAERVKEWLKATELEPWADSTPGAIGRNWARRVGLARALILKPEVLLVDNPVGGLDWRHLNWWLDFLGRLCTGHPLLDGHPLTLVVTASDFRPWKGRAKQFAMLRQQRFSVLGSWQQLETASRELVSELLAAESAENRG